MRRPAQKQYFYFRRDDETDQELYRYLMRHQTTARAALFRDIVRSGFRQHLKRRRAKKRPLNGPAPEPRLPTSTTPTRRPSEIAQPWKT